jgi:hypothetical protein
MGEMFCCLFYLCKNPVNSFKFPVPNGRGNWLWSSLRYFLEVTGEIYEGSLAVSVGFIWFLEQRTIFFTK